MFNPRKDVSRGAAGASRNKASTWTRLATVALAAGMMAALAGPAWGQSDDLTLRRDGSKAVPVVADVSVRNDAKAPNVPALRRDGSQAEAFVAQVGTASEKSSETAPTSSGESSGFHWGDAAIGAGLGAAAVLLMVGAVSAVRRRTTTRAASAAAAR
jgi:hypothetical protein